MIRTIFLLLCFSMAVMAKAPVFDDSENFALLEEQSQAADELPVARDEAYSLDADALDASTSQDQPENLRNIDFVNKIQELQKEIQELRGQLEVQAHELEELKQQQVSQNADETTNPTTLPSNKPQEQAASHVEPPAQTEHEVEPWQPEHEKTLSQATKDNQTSQKSVQSVQNVRVNPADEQISYLAAYDLVKQKQFSQATDAMQQFLAKYPRGGYSANAHYWLGELHLARKEYSEAITQFDTVIQDFKSSSKYAPSRLKLGYALADSGHIGEAKQQLLAVINRYPDTPTARLAHVKLEKLGG